MITSKDNEYIKHVIALSQKKYREEYHEYIVEGIKMTLEAIAHNEVSKILISSEIMSKESYNELLRCLKANRINESIILDISSNVFKKVCDTTSPQGIICIVKYKDLTINQFLESAGNTIVLLDKVQDPGNVGTIIRSIDAGGIKDIVLSFDSADPYNPKVVRSTMGGIFRSQILHLDNDINYFIEEVKKLGYKLIVTSLEAKDLIYDVDLVSGKNIIVVGNESQGVSKEVLEKADIIVKIPMIGQAESLNVAVATSIIVFEKVRQLQKLND